MNGLVVLHYKLALFFDFGLCTAGPHFCLVAFVLPSPLYLVHILLVKPRKHSLQRLLGRYKSKTHDPEFDMKAVYAEATEKESQMFGI